MREAVRFSGPLKRATVSCEDGRWFVALQIEADEVKPVVHPQSVVGIDLGVRHWQRSRPARQSMARRPVLRH
jgi:putative transposase